jgi:hypothetical protein
MCWSDSRVSGHVYTLVNYKSSHVRSSFMGVISIRVPDEMEARMGKAHIKPGEVAKAAWEAALRRAAVEEQLAWLESHRMKSTADSTTLIRQIRDEE